MVYLAVSIRNVGSGVAVLHGWHVQAGLQTQRSHPPLEEFTTQNLDIYVAPDGNGLWLSALRDPAPGLITAPQCWLFSARWLRLSDMTENNAAREVCIWTYWVRPEAEEGFKALLARHWPTLRELGFVTDDSHMVFRSSDDPPVYVEIMTFEAGGMRPAHEHPDVIPIWEAMKPLVEDRAEDRTVPGMSFPFYRLAEVGTRFAG